MTTGAIEGGRSVAHSAFVAWANVHREVLAVRLKGQGRAARGGTAEWWRKLDDTLRAFVLSQVAPDDWERYMSAPWASLPDGLRSAVGMESRAIENKLSACRWR